MLKAQTDRSPCREEPQMTATQSRTRFGRIVHRVASIVEEMNYGQRRRDELFLGLDERH